MHGKSRLFEEEGREWISSEERKSRAGKLTGFGGAAVGIESFHRSTLNDINKKEIAADILGVIQKDQVSRSRYSRILYDRL